MKLKIQEALDQLQNNDISSCFTNLNRGLEKESLRVDAEGKLAQTCHPIALGSTLTHPTITTDYSESLLDFVTGLHQQADGLLEELYRIHQFTYQHLGSEKLWVNSMPCIVESEQTIPIARYGRSNVAQMKEAYRRGLGHRYGRLMQTIAGIHFNFSLPDSFWAARHPGLTGDKLQDAISADYFGLIRNYHRLAWLGIYLFGASPAVCKTFLQGREHSLQDMDAHSFYAPYATSLRLSGLGYSNDAQSGIEIGYNNVEDFVASLRQAIQTPHPDYEKIGTKVDGVYEQLNPNLLQIENEFYAVIRPKRVANSGESPSVALKQRGVQYVEVRSLDLNPFEPVGINKECIHFMDMLLLACILSPSPDIDSEEWAVISKNRQDVVMNGRDPNLKLTIDNQLVDFSTAAAEVLQSLEPIAEFMDKMTGKDEYKAALERQRRKIDDCELTPSARIVNTMREQQWSFFEFAMGAARKHEQHFKTRPLCEESLSNMRQQARDSIDQQAQIEASDEMTFDEFLEDYFTRQNAEV